jgi:trehalose synthase
MKRFSSNQTSLGLAELILMLGYLAASASAQLTAVPEQPSAKRSTNSKEYVEWLEARSMLSQSEQLSHVLSGKGAQWQHEFAEPQPRAAIQRASVWLLAYPGSVITGPGETVIASWGDRQLWDALNEIGIDLLHTGPVNRAGGIKDREYTPTVDGLFDPISFEIDPELGTEKEYRRMVQVAREHHGVIAGDLVPLHTGKGADFLLAIRAYKDYPGMYTMVEIDKKHWPQLPAIENPWKTALVSDEIAEKLHRAHYIPGRIDSCDADPEVRKSSGWSATGEIEGVDGKRRRWVYLHYFKPGQPALDWLDPSCAAQQVVSGNVVRTIDDLGAKVLRLDAVPFLGIEPKRGSATAFHFQHPLSILNTNYLAFMTRKLGGWTFQELNAPPTTVKQFLEEGPDFSYDFFTRTEGLHALLTGDAALLRQAYSSLLAAELQPLRLVHDLQNHDEITYQLVSLDALRDEKVDYHGRPIAARKLREQILDEMRDKAAGKAAPYNLLYRTTKDGVATTYVGFIAAALGIRELGHITASQQAEIKRGHLLMAFANAMQPGIFCLSSWDLVGALPLPRSVVEKRFADEDYRWINRGAVDLLGINPSARTSALGLPRTETLYGPLPQQLQDPDSFAMQLKRMLAARKKYKIELAKLMAAPNASHSAVCILLMRPPDTAAIIITALNFSRESIKEEVDFKKFKQLSELKLRGNIILNCVSEKAEGEIDNDDKMKFSLEPWSGKTYSIDLQADKRAEN